MKKIKYSSYITEEKIEGILLQKYPDHKCPSCRSNGIYAGSIEKQYDEKQDDYVILSFDVFCKDCGGVFMKWDNTTSEFFLGQR